MNQNYQFKRSSIFSRTSTEEISLVPPPEATSHLKLEFHRCVIIEGINIVREYESSRQHLVKIHLTEVAHIDVSKRLGSLFKSMSL